MRMSEILPYLDLQKIEDDMLVDILRAMDRLDGHDGDPDALRAQYGDELADLEIESARLELARLRAEIGKLRAEAKADLLDAERDYRRDN